MNAKQKKQKEAQRRAAMKKAKAAAPEPETTSVPTDRPRIIALLSWFDENPAWLAATIASLAKVEVDHLVAVDGAYLLYPQGKATSPPEQIEAIAETANGLGIGLTLHQPSSVWFGNEVEKRSAMFALGEIVARPSEDWYLVIDADEVVKDLPIGLHQQLAETDLDVARVTFLNRSAPTTEQERAFHWDPISRVEIPIFFRSIPGLRVEGNHFTYVTPDGRKLWTHGLDQERDPNAAESLDLTDLKIDHRTAFRGKHRAAQQRDYYQRRERVKAEFHPCIECGERATKTVHVDPEKLPSGEFEVWEAAVCDDCFSSLKAKLDDWCEANGVPVGYFGQVKPLGINA